MHAYYKRLKSQITAKRLLEALRSPRGAIDLASIMVGVIVIGVISSIAAATLFSVIPWSQDEAAKASLGSVHTAESVMYTTTLVEGDGRYGDLDELTARSLVAGNTSSLDVLTDGAGACYVAVATSATGRAFYVTDSVFDPVEVTGMTDNGCTDLSALFDVAPDIEWVETTGTGYIWAANALALDYDGSHIALTDNRYTAYGGGVWYSDTRGASWTRISTNSSTSVALSHSGDVIAAGSTVHGAKGWQWFTDGGATLVAEGGNAYTSNNLGRSVVLNADGSRLALGISNRTRIISDGGATHRTMGTYSQFTAVAMSADGARVVGYGNSNYGSVGAATSNYGVTSGPIYFPVGPAGNSSRPALAASHSLDSRLFVIDNNAYVTHDSGGVWTHVLSDVSNISRPAMSGDGQRMAVVGDGMVWVSVNGGQSWYPNTSLGSGNWRALAISGDGSTIAASEASHEGVVFLGRF